MLNKRLLTAALFILTTADSPLAAGPSQTQPPHATLSGFVYDADNGEALIGSNVHLKEIQAGTTTNLNGYYALPRVPAGTYTLVSTYIGYEPHLQAIVLAPQEDTSIDIVLRIRAQQMAEVVIVADPLGADTGLYERQISKLELSSAQIGQIPQVIEADLLRSLQTLPGIVPVSDYSSAPYVRGGTPDQNLYLIDGTDVYNPEHAFGLFSVFNPDALKKVEVHKGGFGAEYGGRLSSVLNVTNLDGNKKFFEGSAALSLLSARATIQMPLRGRGSFSASFRRTYFDQTVGRAIDDIPPYFFYDGNFKAFIDVSSTNKLTVSGFGGRDALDFDLNRNSTEKAGLRHSWGNKSGSVRWTTVWTPRLFANFWLTGSRFASDFDLGEVIGFTERNKVTDITVKGDLEYSHSQLLSARFGFEHKSLRVLYRQLFPDARTDISKKPTHYSAYATARLRPSPQWEAEAGLRYHLFDSGRTFSDLSPRLSLKHRITRSMSIKASTGIYRQYLNRIPRAFITDIWTTANEFQQRSTARHYILGYQWDLDGRFELEVETYYKDYDDIHVFNEAFLAAVTTDIHEDGKPVFSETIGLFHEGEGSSRGVEALFRKRVGSVTGWLGYSRSRTEYAFATLNGGDGFPPRHDKTSTVNAVATLDLKSTVQSLRREPPSGDASKWLLGANFIYASGQPITRPSSGYIASSSPDSRNSKNLFTGSVRDFEVMPGSINGFRLPPYIRLDVSVKYRTRYRDAVWTTYVQVFNAGNRRNIWFVQYDDDSGGGLDVVQELDTIPMFPILPTVGVHVSF